MILFRKYQDITKKIRVIPFLVSLLVFTGIMYFIVQYVDLLSVRWKIENIEQQLIEKKIGLQEALEQSLQISNKRPDNAYALSFSAKLYSWLEDYKRAFETYNEALNLDPDNVDILKAVGRLSIATFQLERAEGYIRTIIDLEKDKRSLATAYMDLGIIQESQGDFVGALESYDTSISIDQNFAEVFVQKGFLLLNRLGNITNMKERQTQKEVGVEESLKKALVINPRLTSAYLLSFMVGNYDSDYERMANMKIKALEVLPMDDSLNIIEKQRMIEKINTLSSIKVLSQEEYEKNKDNE